MTDRLPDRWSSRDLPFLVAAAREIDAGETALRAEHTPVDLAAADRIAAAMALVPTYLTGKPLTAAEGVLDVVINGLTERGRRAVGLWPNDDTANALVDALQRAAEATDDPDQTAAEALERTAR